MPLLSSCAAVLLLLCAIPSTTSAGQLQVELFDGPSACAAGAPACAATEYRTFIDASAVVAYNPQRTRLRLVSTQRHSGGSTRLDIRADVQTGRATAYLLEHDLDGRETFRSTRGRGVIQLPGPDCHCGDGRIDLLFPRDYGTGSGAAPRTLRLTRGSFSTSDDSCRSPVQVDIRETERIAVSALSCGARRPPSRPVASYDDEPVLYAAYYGYVDTGCYADYPPVEDDDSGCGGDEPPPDDDSYYGDGCGGDTVDSDYDSGGCEGDTSDSDFDGGGCEGDDYDSGDCEGDAHAATRRARGPRRGGWQGFRLRTLPVALVALALVRTAARRRRTL